MRLIKLGLISFVLIFGLITAISLLIPSQIRISKAINLSTTREKVFAYIRDTATWPQWHPAFMPVNHPGNVLPKNVIVKTIKTTDSLLVMLVQQEKKRTMHNVWQVYTFPSTNTITLQWYIDFDLPWYPWQKFSSLFYEDTYGKMIEAGLSNIKKVLDQQVPDPNSF